MPGTSIEVRLGRSCEWGLKLSFHPSRSSRLSSSDATNLADVESERPAHKNFLFVDETAEVEHGYKDEDKTIDTIVLEAGNQSSELPCETKTLSPKKLSYPVPPVPDQPINAASLISQSSTEVLAWPINNHLKAKLLSIYFQECSSWCEVTDSTRPFSTLWGKLMSESLVFEAAAVALAPVMGIKRKNISDLLATEIHRFSRETLKNFLSVHSEGSLLAATIFCMYYAARGSLIDKQSAVHMWMAYLTRRMTLIPPETWDVILNTVSHIHPQDIYCNRAIWITARVINELSKEPDYDNEKSLQGLWDELQEWIVERPDNVRRFMEVDTGGESAYTTILFSNSPAICGNMYFHIGSILLLATGKIHNDLSAMTSPVCHARRAIAISITNDSK
ncbi:hypothetical protein ACMFMG_008497 [Clarireedia jacksonii]